MKKVKSFTHTDFDGTSCAILMSAAYNEGNVDITYCDYHNVNERILEFLNQNKPTDYAAIFITDISVNEEVAKQLDLLHRGNVTRVQLLDHHDTAMWLNKYEWAHVQSVYEEADRDYKTSGTSLVVDYFKSEGIELSSAAIELAEVTRKYDTWEWHDVYNDEVPKDYNDLLYMIGRESFYETMMYQLTVNNSIEFLDTDQVLLTQRKKEIKKYIKDKEEQLFIMDTGEHGFAGIVFAESHISELGNELCKRHEQLAYVMMIDLGKGRISFRTIRNDIHLGNDVASKYGGGGHAKAAGGKIDKVTVANFLEQITK